MTKREAILRAAELIGTELEADKLGRYIDQLDMRAQIDIFGIDVSECRASEDVLVLPPPYDEAYCYYAAAQVNFEREEYELYNNLYSRCQQLYSAYARLYNRNRKSGGHKVTGLW